MLDENKIQKFNQSKNLDTIMSIKEEQDTKIFEPYKHYLSVRVIDYLKDYYVVNNAINNIPYGYEVYTIYPLAIPSGFSGIPKTKGYCVWFVNNETVEAELTYNSANKKYGYYTFGKVKEKQKVK